MKIEAAFNARGGITETVTAKYTAALYRCTDTEMHRDRIRLHFCI